MVRTLFCMLGVLLAVPAVAVGPHEPAKAGLLPKVEKAIRDAVYSGKVLLAHPTEGKYALLEIVEVPAIIETAEARNRVHGLPQPKFGHREKFGNDLEKHRDFSAVTHVTRDKGIPPFLLLHVAGHPDTSAQAQRLGNVLKDAGIPVTLFGAKETTHSKINEDLGRPDDPATKALLEFLGKALNR